MVVLPILLFFSLNSFSQNKNCIASINVTVEICGDEFNDSSACPKCFECRPRLISLDSNYKVVSFILGIDYCDDCEYQEIIIEGNYWGSNPFAKRMLSNIKKGSIVSIHCIRAVGKNGKEIFLKERIFQY